MWFAFTFAWKTAFQNRSRTLVFQCAGIHAQKPSLVWTSKSPWRLRNRTRSQNYPRPFSHGADSDSRSTCSAGKSVCWSPLSRLMTGQYLLHLCRADLDTASCSLAGGQIVGWKEPGGPFLSSDSPDGWRTDPHPSVFSGSDVDRCVNGRGQ